MKENSNIEDPGAYRNHKSAIRGVPRIGLQFIGGLWYRSQISQSRPCSPASSENQHISISMIDGVLTLKPHSVAIRDIV